jgi:hypothetical protein
MSGSALAMLVAQPREAGNGQRRMLNSFTTGLPFSAIFTLRRISAAGPMHASPEYALACAMIPSAPGRPGISSTMHSC